MILETILKISIVAYPSIATANEQGETEAMDNQELFDRKLKGDVGMICRNSFDSAVTIVRGRSRPVVRTTVPLKWAK